LTGGLAHGSFQSLVQKKKKKEHKKKRAGRRKNKKKETRPWGRRYQLDARSKVVKGRVGLGPGKGGTVAEKRKKNQTKFSNCTHVHLVWNGLEGGPLS